MESREPRKERSTELMWPHNVLERSPVYQWIKVVVLMVAALWLLLKGESERPIEYVQAVCLLAMGLISWGALVAAVVRRVRTGRWTSRSN